MNGAPNKLDQITQYHIGETAHSLSRVSLQPGGVECLVYTTMLGAIGAFVPFGSREDVDFFSHLEMHMRQVTDAAPSLFPVQRGPPSGALAQPDGLNPCTGGLAALWPRSAFLPVVLLPCEG